uniref:Uncharacterized protein n=1 Tax=Cacopsylla melanoneura TaxID=428564 RepID=A0A8D8ZYQ0_9HEMI
MVSLVIKLLLTIGLIVSSCEASSKQLGPPIHSVQAEPFDICLNGNTMSCDTFKLAHAKTACGGETVQNWYPAPNVAYTYIISSKCINQTCHVEVGTSEKTIHASVDCTMGIQYANCKCVNFQE